MIRFITWRLVGMVVVILSMTFIVFLLRSVVPSDPARAALGSSAPLAAVRAERVALGLNHPLWQQYRHYLGQLLHGNLGLSVTTLNPVRSDIATALPASLELLLAAAILAIVMAVVLATVQGLLRGTSVFSHAMVAAGSAPIFLTGLLMTYIFWFRLGWFPSSGRTSIADPPTGPTKLLVIDGLLHGRPGVTVNALEHLALPALTLALPMSVAIGRTLRSSIVGVLRQDYIRTARSKGLTEFKILVRHVLRNASTAAISMTGLQIGLLFANLIIVEQIFGWPGLGLYLSEALSRSDLNATLGVALLFGVTYIVINALVDVLQAVADPRVSLE